MGIGTWRSGPPIPPAGAAGILSVKRPGMREMSETCSINLEVRLPRDLAAAAEEVQRNDPEFMSRVVLYGLTRRTVFDELRSRAGDRADSRTLDGPVL